MKKPQHLKINFFFLILFLCSFTGIAQQKIKNVVRNASINSTKDAYVIKNNIIVDKPVSPILYGTMIELGFGRCENPWAEKLYNRDFEEDEPISGGGWLDMIDPNRNWNTGGTPDMKNVSGICTRLVKTVYHLILKREIIIGLLLMAKLLFFFSISPIVIIFILHKTVFIYEKIQGIIFQDCLVMATIFLLINIPSDLLT